jgi:hypothetical protein
MDVSGQLHVRPHYPRERALDTHWIGDWVDPRADLDAMDLLGVTVTEPGALNAAPESKL